MLWQDVYGRVSLKKELQDSLNNGRVAHAQLLYSAPGTGGMDVALAYANAILTQESGQMLPLDKLLQHPDLHFSVPVATTPLVDKPTTKLLYKEWLEFLPKNLFASVLDWLSFLEIEKKQGIIPVREISDISQRLALNSYAGGFKVLLMWLPEYLPDKSANKLLKLLEEPPKKTVFLLVSHAPNDLLPTLVSRCQATRIPGLTAEEMAQYLAEKAQGAAEVVEEIAAHAYGNVQWAMTQINAENDLFAEYFVQWVRMAFRVKSNVAALQDIVKWTQEIATWSRSRQKDFLQFCSEVFRMALLYNYGADALRYEPIRGVPFKWEGFFPFIHGANIPEILEEINASSYHIERNANSKLIFLDTTLKLTRFLHKKSS